MVKPELRITESVLDQFHFGINSLTIKETSLPIHFISAGEPDREISLPVGFIRLEDDHDRVAELERHRQYVRDSETPGIKEHIRLDTDAVFLSGFGANHKDGSITMAALYKHFRSVFSLSHEDSVDAAITPVEPALNTKEQSFLQSAEVMMLALEKLEAEGLLKRGVTLVGHSTGCAIEMTMALIDLERQAVDRQYVPMIKNLVLLSPAGILDMKSYEALGFGALATPLQFLYDSVRDIPRIVRQHYASHDTHTNEKPVRTVPSMSALAKNVHRAVKNTDWRPILPLHIAFEIGEYVLGLGSQIEYTLALPPVIQNYSDRWHRFWHVQNPHWRTPNPTQARKGELIAKDSSVRARNLIRIPIHIVLAEKDTAVPLHQFLTPEERDYAHHFTVTPGDEAERKKYNARIYESHRQGKTEFHTISRKELLRIKKKDYIMHRAMNNIIKSFSHNRNVTVRIIEGANHMDTRTEIEYVIPGIITEMASGLPEKESRI